MISELTEEKLAGHLYDSLQNKILPLDDELIVYPAHGAGSACGKNMSKETSDTLGNQKKTNYALRPGLTREVFIGEVLHGLMPPPGYFPKNVLMNIQGYESIDTVIERGQKIPFTAAINLKVNRMHLRYLLAPVLTLVFILFASPDIIKDSALRLIHHSEYFERQAPFRFSVLNMPLQTVQFQDFEVNIGVDGSMLPEEAMISINGFDYPLIKKSPSGYTYIFVKPQKDIVFHIAPAGFRSKDFELKVLPKPIIVKFRTDLKYPNYLGKKAETVQKIGDMTVPEGNSICLA